MGSSFLNFSIRTLLRPLLICIILLGLYQILIWARVVPPSDGINQWQTNIVKAQRYIYEDNSDLNLILVGSSLTDNIKVEDLGSDVANLAMAGGAAQTGLEIVARKESKPLTLLVEVNSTIDRKLDSDLVVSLFDPFSHLVRLGLPMFRDEYRPVSVLVNWLKKKSKQQSSQKNEQQNKEQIRNLELTQRTVEKLVKEGMKPLPANREKTIRAEAEYVKKQIARLKQQGWRVIIFNVPGEQRVESTTMHKQEKQMMRELFPEDSFEWLPEPSSRDWVTSDGIHLVRSDAKDYALFIREKLSKK